jgi:hypothetical protein
VLGERPYRFFLGIRGRKVRWAGYHAADLMSLVSSTHRNDLNILVYVKDVLDRLLAGETNYDAMAVKRARRRIVKTG